MSTPTGDFRETRTRSLTKTVSWRAVAVMNSFSILLVSPTDRPLANAVAMNITGFCVYYMFERVWNKIGWGRTPVKNEPRESHCEPDRAEVEHLPRS